MSAADESPDSYLLTLFRSEVDAEVSSMTNLLLELERDPSATHHFEALLRSAHSLKGAARVVNRDAAVTVAHAMEECFVTVQRGGATLSKQRIDQLLRGVDLLSRIAHVPEPELAGWSRQHHGEISAFVRSLSTSEEGAPPPQPVPPEAAKPAASAPQEPAPPVEVRRATATRAVEKAAGPSRQSADGRSLRVAAANLNRLLGLAGEAVVASRWLDDFTSQLRRFKSLQGDLTQIATSLSASLAPLDLDERLRGQLQELQTQATLCHDTLAKQLDEVELFDRRLITLSKRLYQEVLDCRMRPFEDGIQGFPRMVRDTARSLGKEVNLTILGRDTPVDRDIIERVEAPLNHLLRNAVDHGIELPAERRKAGKPEAGVICLEARHSSGMLVIEVADDGRGIDLEGLRKTVVEKGLATAQVAGMLSEAELLEFLFLPGFTMKERVTEISGRGVGLDVVQTMVKQVGGTVRIYSEHGRGTRFHLELPLTLSVLRALMVEISGEPYAFPLARVVRATKVPRDAIQSIEGREHFTLDGEQIGLVSAHQVLGMEDGGHANGEISVIVLGEKLKRYGFVVDRLLGGQDLVVRTLDPRLGKVKDISAAAMMPDQKPALIFDVDDLLRSIENIVSGGRVAHIRRSDAAGVERPRKRVLVVDDSLTVRELERKLIESRGYHVEVAVDGMDAWNAVRSGSYDLVVTDVDMPRLDGIELVRLIKADPRTSELPVMIISYKDREEDRRRGLDAGADYYLAKGSFHDQALLRAVADLIGVAE